MASLANLLLEVLSKRRRSQRLEHLEKG